MIIFLASFHSLLDGFLLCYFLYSTISNMPGYITASHSLVQCLWSNPLTWFSKVSCWKRQNNYIITGCELYVWEIRQLPLKSITSSPFSMDEILKPQFQYRITFNQANRIDAIRLWFSFRVFFPLVIDENGLIDNQTAK